MLELVARHGGFDLTIRATGDLDVDQHHTVEDVGIALGRRWRPRSATRRGINRAGYFVMPMDETLAVAAIDLGGRIHAVVDLRLRVRRVGDLQTLSWSTTSSTVSRRAPRRTFTSRCCMAARAITRSKRSSRRSRARCGSPARATGDCATVLPSTKGLL